MNKNTNCLNCIYLSKRAGTGNYFIFKCSYWGLTTQKILPQSVIISSIGKKCPFFKQKKIKRSDEDTNDDNKNKGFDVIV